MTKKAIKVEEELLDDETEFDYEDDDLEDEEDDVEEGFEPANAPAQNSASVVAAGRVTKQSKKRHNDKSGGDKVAPKADKGIVRELYNKMNSMSMEDLRKLHGIMMEEDFDIDEFSAESEDVLEDVEYDFTDDLKDLVESEATLSEEFKEKTAIIMEAAIKSKLKAEVARLEESYDEQLTEAVETIQEDLVAKIDSYLNYVVENWMEENKLAVQSGLRTEIAEKFMNKLKDLFVESYIEVPEDKVDLVDDLAEQVESLEEELNGMIEQTMTMREELEAYKRQDIIFEMADGLADTQIDRLAELAEGLDFDDEDTFRKRVAVIKETYFKKSAPKKTAAGIAEEVEDESQEEIEISGTMAQYVNALKKSQK